MCAGCVMAAAAGASGVRSWLQTRHLTWLTPKRLRNATIALFVAAFGIASVGMSGSTPPQHHATQQSGSTAPQHLTTQQRAAEIRQPATVRN